MSKYDLSITNTANNGANVLIKDTGNDIGTLSGGTLSLGTLQGTDAQGKGWSILSTTNIGASLVVVDTGNDIGTLSGSAFTLGVLQGAGPQGKGWTGVSYDVVTGKFVFTSDDGLSYTSENITADLDTAVAAAQAAEAATEFLFNQFGDQYLGAHATDPTVDTSGNPLTDGDIYFNTTDSVLKFYTGTAWVAPEAIATTAASEALASQVAAELAETNAATSEGNAATSEANASNSASAASTSETNAATSETNAANSEAATAADLVQTNLDTIATAADRIQTGLDAAATAADLVQTNLDQLAVAADLVQTNQDTIDTAADVVAANASAVAAALSETNAATSEANAAASYDAFDDRYLGAKASAPTLDNDGNALLTGAIYWNTTTTSLSVWDGSAWNQGTFDSAGLLVATNNLSDLNNAATARTNLGLSTVASTGDYADLTNTPAPFDPNTLATVATTGAYSDLSGLPTLGTAAATASTAYATAAQGTLATNALPKSGGAMTGAITTNSTFDGRNVSVDGAKLDGIEAGATADQTITLSGDATGSGTGSIVVTVVDDSHNHIISNVDGLQTALDGKLSTSGKAADSNLLDGVDSLGFTRFYNNATLNNSATTTAFLAELAAEYGAFNNNHVVLKISWNYAGNSNLVTGDAAVGTLELAGCVIEAWGGAQKHVRITRPTTGTGGERIAVYNDQGSAYSPSWRAIWTSDSDGAGSGLDADLLDGYQSADTSAVSTVVRRTASGDINARLFRSEYTPTNANTVYFMTQVNQGSDNYLRPSTLAQVRTKVVGGATAGSVGSYVLGDRQSSGAWNSTVAGSNIYPASMRGHVLPSQSSYTNAYIGHNSGTLAGTWRQMGGTQSYNTTEFTLFLRIS